MKKSLLVLSATALLFSCGEKKAEEVVQEAKPTTEVTSPETENEMADFRFHTIIANLPTPVESMQDLTREHLAYNEGFLCPTQNAAKHTTSAAKALNCGIYMVDLTYLTCYHKSNLLLSYLAISHKLATEVDAQKPFEGVINERLEKNIDNQDSLMNVMNAGLSAMEEFLSEENRLVTATQMLTGSWIETQYLLVHAMLETDNPGEHLKTHIFEQREHLANLLKLLHEFKDDAGLHDELAKLQELEKSFLKVHETADVSLDLLKEVAAEIEVIRNDVVAM